MGRRSMRPLRSILNDFAQRTSPTLGLTLSHSLQPPAAGIEALRRLVRSIDGGEGGYPNTRERR